MRRMPVADVERELREVLEAAEHGEPTVVLHKGKPVAVIAPWSPIAEASVMPTARRPGGLLAAVGLLSDWESFETDIADIIDGRQRTVDRPTPDVD